MLRTSDTYDLIEDLSTVEKLWYILLLKSTNNPTIYVFDRRPNDWVTLGSEHIYYMGTDEVDFNTASVSTFLLHKIFYHISAVLFKCDMINNLQWLIRNVGIREI